jgi:hypothetical protein
MFFRVGGGTSLHSSPWGGRPMLEDPVKSLDLFNLSYGGPSGNRIHEVQPTNMGWLVCSLEAEERGCELGERSWNGLKLLLRLA